MDGRPEKESTGQDHEGQKQSPGTHGQFMGDEFRSYMSRKIELQRQQFGLVLPPAPIDAAASRLNFSACDQVDVGEDALASPGTKMTAKDDDQMSASVPSDRGGDQVGSKRNRKEGLSAVLSRLKKRHGSGSSRKLSSRKRRRSAESSQGSMTESSESGGPAELEVPAVPGSVRKSTDEDEDVENDSRDPSESSNDRAEASEGIMAPVRDVHSIRRHRPDLFLLGVVVLVNGFTTPDAATLMRMLQQRGGDLEKYETSRVTHIIASALSTAKALIYKRQRKPTPVVRPEWIVDSCREGKLLPHADYLLEEVKDENAGSKTVKSFFSPPALAKGSTPDANEDVALSETGKNGVHSSILPLPSQSEVYSPKQNVDPHDFSPATKLPNTPCGHQGLESGCGKSQTRAEVPASSLKEDNRMTKEANSPRSKNANVAGVVRTVGNDPNFLDSYFKNSRLSFIGSFKQRVKATGTNANLPTSHRRVRTNAYRFVFHIDIDCFFAAVALRKYPQYRDKPVAVGHGWKSDSKGQPIPVGDGASHSPNQGASKKSYSELSTCNYVARRFGIRKGMFLHQAKELCTDLIVLPYDYEGYEEVAAKVTEVIYNCAEEFEGAVEQVSCDEAYLELFLRQVNEKEKEMMPFDLARSVAETIRSDILGSTKCTASVGVAQNKFLAKLATDKAKPDGSFVVKDDHALLEGLKLRDLPGIGWKLERKLQSHRLESVSDVLSLGDEAEGELCSILGAGNGKKILSYIQGRDDRPVQAAPRKTIGAECNYGVRFSGPYGPDCMLKGLAKEVESRMKAVDVSGKRITLKLLQRKEGASTPAKFLGHGSCNSLSKSCDLPVAVPTCDWGIIFRIGMKLFDELAVKKDDIRGMGIVVSKLSNTGVLEDSGVRQMSTWLKSTEKKRTDSSMMALDQGSDQGSNISKEHSREGSSDGEDSSQIVLQSGDKSSQSKGSVERRSVRFSAGTLCRETYDFAPHQPHAAQSPATAEPAQNRRLSIASSEREGEDFVIPTLSQIDEDVLENLPQDIQISVRRKLQLDLVDKGSGLNGPSRTIGTDVEADEACIRNGEEDGLKAISEDQGLAPEDSDELVAFPTAEGENETSMDYASDAFNDLNEGIVLPPLSQIDTDEVLALPRPMRDEVLKQIRAKKETKRKCSLSPPDKSRKGQDTVARQQTRKDLDGDGHLRQLSVKRMLKLASVKSGNDNLEERLGGESISLTQLESLPLEMQLEIANNDEAPVGSRCTSARATRFRSSAHKTMTPPRPDNQYRSSYCDALPQGPTASGGKPLRFESSQQSNLALPTLDESPSQRALLQASERSIHFEPLEDFYHSNVLPLNKWMDVSPHPSSDDVERVKDFLFICVSEKRLDEVVKMLRVIRRRSDDWSKHPFDILLESVDERLIHTEGRRLDRRSLGLA